MIWTAISAALGLGRVAIESRIEVQEAKLKLKVAEIEAAATIEGARAAAALKAADHVQGWEMLALSQAEKSIKDEVWTYLLATPLIMAFVPGGAPYVHAGFEALNVTPQWYLWAVLAAISMAFGRKVIPEFWKSKKGA